MLNTIVLNKMPGLGSQHACPPWRQMTNDRFSMANFQFRLGAMVAASPRLCIQFDSRSKNQAQSHPVAPSHSDFLAERPADAAGLPAPARRGVV